MCEYVKENKCTITLQVCPYMYWCDKTRSYRPSSYMPEKCKVLKEPPCPPGYYNIRQERKGFLYIDYKGITIKVKNPFDYVPVYVKVKKNKDGEYKLKD